MRGINKVILLGTLGRDPELKSTAGGTSIVTISLATNEAWKDKTSGDTVERTEWHRVVLWGRLAEIAAQYLKKGSTVYFEGKQHTRKWQGQDGQDRYTTEVVANEMQMLGSGGGTGAGNGRPATADGGQPAPPPAHEFVDDIPF